MELRNKVIAVTGAAGGVGKELVLQLLKKGANVAAIDINQSALEEMKWEASICSESFLTIHVCNITIKTDITNTIQEIIASQNHIDGLINNAGIIQPFEPLTNLRESSIQRLMDINFYGMLNMTTLFLPFLAERPEAFIANVSSMGGFLPVPGQSIYGATKAAVKIATEGLRMELSLTNIHVLLVIPGGIETDIKKNSGLVNEEITEESKMKSGVSLTKPKDAALQIIKSIEKNKAKLLIGTDAKLMDLAYRVAPIMAGKLISKVMAANHGGIFNDAQSLKEKQIPMTSDRY